MDKMLGVMLDCSRNAVMKVETVKKYVKILKEMGYNTLMLYTEDTYEVEGEPCFGHLRGRYSMDELKEIDCFCTENSIELIPCIQTLAHLENMFKWVDEYEDVKDCDNILLCGEEKTYALIDKMISSLAKCFTSRKIHIGMDEAYRVGTGKYQQIHGIEDRFDIINNHLHKVCEICNKYGFEAMIWSDMFVKFAMNIQDQYAEADANLIKEKAELPKNVSLVYWDYYSTDYNRYATQIKNHKIFGRKTYFAGGSWTWKGFAPDNKFSIETTIPAMKACSDEGVDGVFLTMWGDNGSECSKFSVLPSLMVAAEYYHGNTDMENIKIKFKEIVGAEFDDFMLMDELDYVGGKHEKNPSKYLLYNDLFMGLKDYLICESDSSYYERLLEKIKNIQKDNEYSYIFDTYEKLCETLVIKSTLGIRTRTAYKSGDINKVKSLIPDYNKFLELLEDFHKLFQNRWFTENKPHGFDVQDIRLGGLMGRSKSCRDRLIDFTEGKISSIPELEEEVLDKQNGLPSNWWASIVTPNSLYDI